METHKIRNVCILAGGARQNLYPLAVQIGANFRPFPINVLFLFSLNKAPVNYCYWIGLFIYGYMVKTACLYGHCYGNARCLNHIIEETSEKTDKNWVKTALDRQTIAVYY